MNAERAVYKGLDPQSSWRLKAIEVCLRLAEVTLKQQGTVMCRHLGLCPGNKSPTQSVQIGDLMGVLFPFPSRGKTEETRLPRAAEKRSHAWTCALSSEAGQRRKIRKKGRQAVCDWRRWTGSSSLGRPSGVV